MRRDAQVIAGRRTAKFLALAALLALSTACPERRHCPGSGRGAEGLLAGIALAQSGNGYDLSWNTVDGGGQTFSTGGRYTLGGTIGQPDAGALTGGGYTLGSGFWGGGAVDRSNDVYLPLVLRRG
jgi:hypothetical protein